MNFPIKSEPFNKKNKISKTKLILEGDDADEATDDDQENGDGDNERLSLLKNSKKTLSPHYGSEIRSFSPSPAIQRTINSPVAEFDSFSITTQDEKGGKNRIFSLITQLFNILCDVTTKKHSKRHPQTNSKSKYIAKIKSSLQMLKTFVFLSFGLLCITFFSIADEKEQIWTQSIISNLTVNILKCSSNPESYSKRIEILRLKLNGPFSNEKENQISSQFLIIDVYGKKRTTNESIFQSSWKLFIKSPDLIGQQEYSDNKVFWNFFKFSEPFDTDEIEFKINTNVLEYFSINFDCSKLSNYYDNKILFSAILLLFVYVLIIFELCHRTLAAGMGALGGIR